MKLSRRTWLLVFLGFSTIAFLNVTHLYLDDVARAHRGTLPTRIIEEFTGAYLSCAMLPMIIWFALRFRFGGNAARALAGHVAGWFLYTTIHTTAAWASRSALFAIFGLGTYDYGTISWRYPMEGANDFLVYWLLIGLIYLFVGNAERRKTELREAELEGKLSEVKLENLRLQLQPHFLFNTLNAISSVMYEDVARADQMLTQVSDFMRLVLVSGGVQSVPLEEELRVERMYVDIMKTRLERNLMLDVRTAESARNALVPFMLLQPLLENSIRHGMDASRGSIELNIDVARQNGSTVIHVADDGVGIAPGSRNGIGLSNIISRLEYMFGDKASFSIKPRDVGGTMATITLPFIESET